MEEFIDDELPLPSFGHIFHGEENENNQASKRGRKTMKTKKYSHSWSSSVTPPVENASSGRWTDEEHKQFLEGVKRFGRDWKRMQPLIKTRSIVQIRTHAQKLFSKDLLEGPSRLLAAASASVVSSSSSISSFHNATMLEENSRNALVEEVVDEREEGEEGDDVVDEEEVEEDDDGDDKIVGVVLNANQEEQNDDDDDEDGDDEEEELVTVDVAPTIVAKKMNTPRARIDASKTDVTNQRNRKRKL